MTGRCVKCGGCLAPNWPASCDCLVTVSTNDKNGTLLPVEEIVAEMLRVYGIPFTDPNSRRAAIESWSRQIEVATVPSAGNAHQGMLRAAAICEAEADDCKGYEGALGNEALWAAEANAMRYCARVIRERAGEHESAIQRSGKWCVTTQTYDCPTVEQCCARDVCLRGALPDRKG